MIWASGEGPISRRSQQVDVGRRLAATKGRLHLIVDSTGLSIIGEGEWAAVKHGGRGKRAWKKLHLGVDRSGVIIAEVLTDGNANADRVHTVLGDSPMGRQVEQRPSGSAEVVDAPRVGGLHHRYAWREAG